MLRIGAGPVVQAASAGLTQQQTRNFATLKDISMRLKSVTNIQKITKSMKMVAAAKYARAERELKAARPYGHGAKSFYDNTIDEEAKEEKKDQHLMVICTSDRGLCGAVHSNIGRMVKADMNAKPESQGVKFVLIGDKAKQTLSRLFPHDILVSVNDVGKKPPSFADASAVAQEILNSGYKFEKGDIYFNRFKSVVSYETDKLPVYGMDTVTKSLNFSAYDSVDDAALESYMEYSLAALIYYAMKESACSEQSSRMTAMDGASKNAGEMIDKLQLQFNRTRQAVITRELIEIISGAAAV